MNSKPPDQIILYLDSNLGNRKAPGILRQRGINFEIHNDHLQPDAPDEDWIDLCSRRNWVAVTKDLRLKYNAVAKQTILGSSVRIFTISANTLTGEQIGELIAGSYESMQRICNERSGPFLAKIDRQKKITLVHL